MSAISYQVQTRKVELDDPTDLYWEDYAERMFLSDAERDVDKLISYGIPQVRIIEIKKTVSRREIYRK